MSWLVLPEETGPTLIAYDATTDEEAINVAIDGALSSAHSGTVTWTQHPVERDAPITDHGIEDPETLSIAGKITRTPLTYEAVNSDPDPDRFDNVLDDILQIKRERLRVDVVDGFRVFLGYRIAAVTFGKSGEIGQAVEVTIDLIQLREVSAKDEAVPPKKTAKKPATKKTDAGKGTTDAADAAAAAEERRKSVAKDALDRVATPIPPPLPPI